MRTALIFWILLAGAASLFAQKPGEIRPKVADEYESRGNKLADEGKFAEAEAEYRKAIEAAPDWYSPHYELGYMYWNQGKENKEKALAELETGLKMNPECWLCYMTEGNIADDTGQVDQAIALFKKAADIERRSGRPWFNLGITYFRQNRNEEAISSLKRAEELEPKYASPRYVLGMIYYQMGKLFLAQDELFAFSKMETTGKRYATAKELTDFKITIDSRAPEGEGTVATSYCISRAGHMAPEAYRKSHPDAETYADDLNDEREVMETFAQILLELSENGKKPVLPQFAALVKVKQAGFMREFLVAASGQRFAKDKETLPAGRMDDFLGWAKRNDIALTIPKPRCEVRWMGRTW